MAKDIKYKCWDDINEILEEQGNSFVALRKISWGEEGEHEPKIDIRRWRNDINGNEFIGKGVTLTEEGCNNLTTSLVKLGYGDTRDIIDKVRDRDDFVQSLKDSINRVPKEGSEETPEPVDDTVLHDVKELFEGDFGE